MARVFNDIKKHLVMTRHLENDRSLLTRKAKELPGISGLPVVSVPGQNALIETTFKIFRLTKNKHQLNKTLVFYAMDEI